MSKSTADDHIRRACADAALKLLFKFDRPSITDITHHMCRHESACPVLECEYTSDMNRRCRHVTRVKGMIDSIINIIDED